MAFRRQPLSLYIAALIIFSLTSILPVGYMLGQFISNLFKDSTAITSVLVDTRQLVLLGRSATVALSATLVALVLGLPVAIVLAAKDLPCRRLFYSLVLIPLLIPPYIMAGAWIHLLSPTGLVNRTLAAVFGPSARLTVFSMTGCAWCLGVSFFPIIAIIVATGLGKLDRGFHDIARLSTGWWGTFKYATLPQILPHLAASICLVMIFVLGRYGVPSLLGLNTYPVEIFAQFSAFYDDNAAVATSLPLMVLVVILILLQRRIMLNRSYVSITPSSETDNPLKLGKLKPLAAIFLVILFIATVLLPFASVLAYTKSLTQIWLTLRSFSGNIITTSVLALSAAVIATAIALPIGYYLAYNQGRFGSLLDVVCWLPIAIPGTIIGLGLIQVASLAPALRNTDSIGILLLCAYIGMFSAFSIRIFEVAYRRADPNVLEAALIDCRWWYQRLLYIDVPIHIGAIAASMIIVFVLVLGELNATVLLIPPGKATLAVTIDNLLHYGANVKASILCLTQAVFVMLAVGSGFLIWHSAKGR